CDTASKTGRATASIALPGGNGVMSLIVCRVGHACPCAHPLDSSPRRTSARKELRRIAFSVVRGPYLPIMRTKRAVRKLPPSYPPSSQALPRSRGRVREGAGEGSEGALGSWTE